MLTPQDIDDWQTALRSGNYRQARGRYRDGSSYCCLSVLQEIVLKRTPLCFSKVNRSIVDVVGNRDTLGYELSQILHEDIPTFVKLNDQACLSFCEIADKIDIMKSSVKC